MVVEKEVQSNRRLKRVWTKEDLVVESSFLPPFRSGPDPKLHDSVATRNSLSTCLEEVA